MCRSIKRLREGSAIAGDDEIREAALQFVRKVTGFSKPAPHNEAAFDAAVNEIARASKRALASLEVRGASPRRARPAAGR
ncbi:MAG TPA: DUF2277 domain-containing protein [Candidatus Limnocylindria bacterium]|nr:DUF2277 domain-containing protein [Candidatus Limnocylindria bacterium]